MAKLPLEFHPGSRLDVLEAYDWYAQRGKEAAFAYQRELQDAGRAIQVSPERWAIYLFGTRRYLLKCFPSVCLSDYSGLD